MGFFVGQQNLTDGSNLRPISLSRSLLPRNAKGRKWRNQTQTILAQVETRAMKILEKWRLSPNLRLPGTVEARCSLPQLFKLKFFPRTMHERVMVSSLGTPCKMNYTRSHVAMALLWTPPIAYAFLLLPPDRPDHYRCRLLRLPLPQLVYANRSALSEELYASTLP